jgi:hypothetical protein
MPTNPEAETDSNVTIRRRRVAIFISRTIHFKG